MVPTEGAFDDQWCRELDREGIVETKKSSELRGKGNKREGAN